MVVDPITNEILKKWEQAGGNLAKAAREVRAELEEESEEDIYECEHCNAEFSKSEILYRDFGGEIGGITFCPHCKEETKLICVTGVDKKNTVTIKPRGINKELGISYGAEVSR